MCDSIRIGFSTSLHHVRFEEIHITLYIQIPGNMMPQNLGVSKCNYSYI